MAQLLTTLHSCAINPPSLSSPNSVHKVGLTHYNLSCVFETRNSLGKSIAASPRPVTSKRLRRQIGCSASNSSGGKKGNVIEVEDGEELEKYIQDAGDKLVVVDVSTTTCGPCKLIYPKVVNMSIEYPDTLFYKINGDKSSSTRVDGRYLKRNGRKEYAYFVTLEQQRWSSILSWNAWHTVASVSFTKTF
ncbi:thioredoxin-like 2-1, chloroplastic isoform X2 [Cryptomeria japonica]|uniref:thioredoxin-like 2-1, chloroplastic isoform X2 n=1 Tax=Cryptomeria japonica TaxID=3369 RepID=UPI0027DA6E81|nr:thioredoxin-like 2-1, chloroplastic isoform X2 [Cryptomeria japonica]